MTLHCEEMQNNLSLQQAAELFLYRISIDTFWKNKPGRAVHLHHSLHPHSPYIQDSQAFTRLNSPAGPVCAWPHTEAVPCITQQEVTQLLSHTHLVICSLQQHGAVFSYLPAKSIFCLHSWELYHWYRSLPPGVQSVFLLGCTLCLSLQ